MTKVLVVDDKQLMRDSVGAILARGGFSPVAASNGREAMDMIARHRPAAVVTDLKMPEVDGLELVHEVTRSDPELPVILMTAYATVDTAVAALRRGAFDYIRKPFEGDELLETVRRAVRHHALAAENEALRESSASADNDRVLIGQSAAMSRLVAQVERIAPSDGTVLISGESGTGKEVVARMVHRRSRRADRVMLALNCAALSPTLLESELFGHERGAFTGADQMRKGRFELADGGTLLLDEISEIEPPLQAKLLRVLQERQFERVGSSVTMDSDVRIIATTNRDLGAEVAAGRFRQDLYFRLNVLPIRVPALRDRAEDVPLLANHFMARQAMREGRTVKRFDDAAMGLLGAYRWPGNVRELENICERAAVVAPGAVIDAACIEPWLIGAHQAAAEDAQERPVPMIEGRTLEDLEREVIVHTLGHFNGHRARTAKALGIGVRTLGLKLKKWKELNLVASTL